jgi:hypothetical protein
MSTTARRLLGSSFVATSANRSTTTETIAPFRVLDEPAGRSIASTIIENESVEEGNSTREADLGHEIATWPARPLMRRRSARLLLTSR